MSIQVENNLKSKENKEVFEQRAHYVPCTIEEDGPANVSKYFETYIKESENGGESLGSLAFCISFLPNQSNRENPAYTQVNNQVSGPNLKGLCFTVVRPCLLSRYQYESG